MEQNTQRNAVVNLLVLLAAAVCLYAVGQYSKSYAAEAGSLFLGLGTFVALVSVFHLRLRERERLEKLEFEEVTKGKASNALFQGEAEAFPAQRSREQFERFFVPGFTILLFLIQLLAAVYTWRALRKVVAPPIVQPLVAMGLSGLFALILFLLGKYSSGLARLSGQRLLRPSSGHLILGFYICVLVVAGLAAFTSGFPAVDLILAKVFSVLLGVLATETLVSLVLEIYRPRVKGKEGPPLYESRTIGMLGEPGGIVSTVAHTLDYQFGFKVSETWFYQFLRERILLLIAAQLLIFLLSTCFIFIDAGEQGLRERFGKPAGGILQPGLHVKLPWPVDRVYRYSTAEIQSFHVGYAHDEREENQPAVLWTVAHVKDEFNLLVANRDVGVSNVVNGKKSPPVNLLSVSIPVQFQISDIKAWAYNNENSADLLEKIGTREVVRYLVGVDIGETMSTARFRAAEELRARIQAAADEFKLGAKILFVGLQDVHPPVRVAAAYEAVVGARQRREAQILKAQASAAQTNSTAQSTAVVKVNEAEATRSRMEADAYAKAALFTNQLPAYLASPQIYGERVYLKTLVSGGGKTPKVVIGATNANEVFLMNLEQKIRPDLLSVPLPKGK
jgi:regulator of protease activity HflC (stomatin/prohibitin superfamily)